MVKVLLTLTLVFSCMNVAYAEDGITVKIDNVVQVFEQSPVIENGSTLVPVRAIFEKFGAKVEYREVNQFTKEVSITQGEKFITLTLDFSSAILGTYKNGIGYSDKTLKMEVAPKIINNTTMIPLRFASENLGGKVLWDGTTRTIHIYTNPQDPSIAKQSEEIKQNEQVANKKQEEEKNKEALSKPNDKNGQLIQVGDRVRFSFFYGEVQKVDGGRIQVYWDSKDDLWLKDKDVDYMAMLAGIRYKSTQWVDAKDLELER
ncbi:copper amine oxidase N-terminal domain-containing protein [Paenibacillus oryzisoli]|uniref:copper amine oxidase N-terminal domain-containing protein n=1 Tax=Paenibacillus oryzisoli TaxID=1850517 RepID=UPI003D2E56A7